MAIVIAPFKIVGTIDDLNFYLDEGDINRVRQKGDTGVTSEQFKANPVFDPIRNQSKEFGHAATTAKIFRLTFHHFFERAKDGSFAGRVNKVLLEILTEDTTNPDGSRTVAEGIKTEYGKKLLIGFEGNRLKKIKDLLTKVGHWNPDTYQWEVNDLNVTTDIIWPEKATHVHFALATGVWNVEKNTFETNYSQEIIFNKEEPATKLVLTTEPPTTEGVEMTALLITFSEFYRRKLKPLKRGLHATTIIHVKR